MLFNSLNFALFIGVVYALFLLIPGRFKVGWLLVASYAFYGFSSLRACGVLGAVSLLSYWGGGWIARAEEQPRRQLIRLFTLVGGMAAILVYFKFVPLIALLFQQFAAGARAGHPDLLFLFVPVGYSYYLFQSAGYLVDVYWGKPLATSLGRFLLFMNFFPKVMMGPIERGDQLLPQIDKLPDFRFDYDRMREALLLFGWGLFKKLVIAERLGSFVDDIYRSPAESPGLVVAAAMAAFGFQLYSDFSGYTDMALGVGKLFGLELTQNFDRPFMATNIQDFWRRWHISFSKWIGDYLYLPLRMSLRSLGKLGLVIALMIAFFVVGVWHGTGWTFAIFGLLQGVYMAVSTLTLGARNAFFEKRGQLDSFWLTNLRRIATFAMMAFAWVFFRANSVPEAFAILKAFLQPGDWHAAAHTLTEHSQLRLAGLVIFMEIVEHLIRSGTSPFSLLLVRPWWQRWPVYIALILAILVGSVVATAQRFIYLAF